MGLALGVIGSPPAAAGDDDGAVAAGVHRAAADCAEVKCVALTFDDGPSRYTERYLKILKRHGAVATFFVIGSQVSGRASTLVTMAAQGNEIASHTWSHPALTSLSGGQIRQQVERTARQVAKITGKRPSLLRPPYGSVNGRVLAALGEADVAAIMWDVDTRDWQSRSPSAVFGHIKRETHRGSIILMHDLHRASADALERIIHYLDKRGYTLVTVTDLLGGTVKPGKAYYSGRR
jgi:peptidoglycan/xylan/chitin deacetylase (PgdA/CDA1 family)